MFLGQIKLPATANQMAQQAVDEAGPANDIEGIYEAVYEDAADGKFRLRHFLNVDGQRQELHLKQSVSEVVSGAKVRVRVYSKMMAASLRKTAQCC